MNSTSDLETYRAQHEQDTTLYGEVLDDVRHMIRTGLSGLEEISRKLAAVIPQVEEGQRNLRVNADSITVYARQHGQDGVTTPDQLNTFLASLSDRERQVYEQARLSAQQAAYALGLNAKP